MRNDTCAAEGTRAPKSAPTDFAVASHIRMRFLSSLHGGTTCEKIGQIFHSVTHLDPFRASDRHVLRRTRLRRAAGGAGERTNFCTAHPDVNFELHAWRNNYGTTCENPLHGTKAEMRRASKGVRREPGSVVTGFDGSVNTSAL